MIRVAICDDEKYMVDLLADKVRSFFQQAHVEICLFCFSRGKDLLCGGEQLDIVFLDVWMKPLNGFETAKALRRGGFHGFLIFITVLEQEVFHAFEVQAFDYLVKPLQEEDFARTMNRVLSCVRERGEKQLLVQRGAQWDIVPLEEILYCEAIDKKVYLHLQNAPVISYYETIEALEKKLDSCFFKCHRSYLVNLQHIKGYQTGAVYLKNGAALPVSRLRAAAFLAAVSDYVSKWGNGA